MGQTFRLILLVSFSYITYLLFELILIFTLVPQYCWQLSDYWLNPSQYHNPFWLFSGIFFLLFLWAVTETGILLKGKRFSIYKVGILGSSVFFFAALGLMLITFWQSLQMQEGKLTYADFWYKHFEVEVVERTQQWDHRREEQEAKWEVETPDLPGNWERFVEARTCDRDIERTSISEDQWEELDREFNGIWEAYYLREDRNKIYSNLLKMYGFTDFDSP